MTERLVVRGAGAVPCVEGSRYKVLLGNCLDDGVGKNRLPGIFAPLFRVKGEEKSTCLDHAG